MVPDRQKVWTDGRTEWTDGRTHGRRQNYIRPTSSGNNEYWIVTGLEERWIFWLDEMHTASKYLYTNDLFIIHKNV